MGAGHIAAIVLAVYIILIVYYVFVVIANWRIFTKAGEKGWKTLIPVYNQYTQFKLTWKAYMVIPVVVLGLLAGLAQLDALKNNTTIAVIGGLAGTAGTVLWIIGQCKLAKSFNKGGGFALGLVLIPPIFQMILGFGKAEYIGNTTEMKKEG